MSTCSSMRIRAEIECPWENWRIKDNLLPTWNSWSNWKDKSWLKITDGCRLMPWRFLQVRMDQWHSTIWASGEEEGHHLEMPIRRTSDNLRVERCLGAGREQGQIQPRESKLAERHHDGFSEPREKNTTSTPGKWAGRKGSKGKVRQSPSALVLCLPLDCLLSWAPNDGRT